MLAGALAGLLAAGCAGPAPRPPDPALEAARAVVALRAGSVPCDSAGAAVHLGAGRFATAAHVADGSVQRLRGGCAGTPPALRIGLGGAELPAMLAGAGRDRVEPGIGQRYLGGLDLALLRAAAPATLPAARPCAADPAPGTPALLVTPRRSVRLRVAGAWADPDPAFGRYLEIAMELSPGESGGALFEAGSGCLAGLVSHRDLPRGAAEGPARTRLVPASVLSAALAGW